MPNSEKPSYWKQLTLQLQIAFKKKELAWRQDREPVGLAVTHNAVKQRDLKIAISALEKRLDLLFEKTGQDLESKSSKGYEFLIKPEMSKPIPSTSLKAAQGISSNSSSNSLKASSLRPHQNSSDENHEHGRSSINSFRL